MFVPNNQYIQNALKYGLPSNAERFFRKKFDNVSENHVSSDRGALSRQEMVALKARVDEIVQGYNDLTNGAIMTKEQRDLSKVIYICNYLLGNVMYAQCQFDPNSSNVYGGSACKGSIYGALVLHEAICSGISEAFDCLCKVMDVESTKLLATPNDPWGGGHAFNSVKIGETWYKVDVSAEIGLNPGHKIKGGKWSDRQFLVPFSEPLVKVCVPAVPNCTETYPREKINQMKKRLSDRGLKFEYSQSAQVIQGDRRSADEIKRAFNLLGGGIAEAGYQRNLKLANEQGYVEFTSEEAVKRFLEDPRYATWSHVIDNGKHRFYPPNSKQLPLAREQEEMLDPPSPKDLLAAYKEALKTGQTAYFFVQMLDANSGLCQIGIVLQDKTGKPTRFLEDRRVFDSKFAYELLPSIYNQVCGKSPTKGQQRGNQIAFTSTDGKRGLAFNNLSLAQMRIVQEMQVSVEQRLTSGGSKDEKTVSGAKDSNVMTSEMRNAVRRRILQLVAEKGYMAFRDVRAVSNLHADPFFANWIWQHENGEYRLCPPLNLKTEKEESLGVTSTKDLVDIYKKALQSGQIVRFLVQMLDARSGLCQVQIVLLDKTGNPNLFFAERRIFDNQFARELLPSIYYQVCGDFPTMDQKKENGITFTSADRTRILDMDDLSPEQMDVVREMQTYIEQMLFTSEGRGGRKV
ncbi:MAG: hypothetical protein K2M17_02230 [Bacilli bacterium]|nr:hypothetical protein [Bacilli bacterium]